MSRYIDADAVLELIQEEFHKTDVNGEEQIGVLKCHRIVREALTADVVEVRHGEWLPTNIPTMFSGVIHECSICKAKDGEHSSILGYYCWRCGAKMDGERSANDNT